MEEIVINTYTGLKNLLDEMVDNPNFKDRPLFYLDLSPNDTSKFLKDLENTPEFMIPDVSKMVDIIKNPELPDYLYYIGPLMSRVKLKYKV
jgi:hypothetical protein